jgi:GNAT superfamily N-acetyltransferase
MTKGVGHLAFRRSQDVELGRLAGFLGDGEAASGPEAESFRRVQSPAYYGWLIGTGPVGEAVSWVACDGDRIVGSLTASLRPIRVLGESLILAKLEEMKTDPAYRGRGVMSQVFARVKAEAIERGVSILMGGPTSPLSFPIFTKRLKFEAPFGVANCVRLLRLRRGAGGPESGSLVDTPGEPAIDADVVPFLERTLSGSDVATVRDRSYLQWRYLEHPDSYEFLTIRDGLEIRGFAVCKVTKQRGYRLANAVELIAAPGRDRRALLRAFTRWAKGVAMADFAVVWPPEGRRFEALSSAYVPRFGGDTRVVFWFAPALAERFRATLRSRRAWWMGMGDLLDI